LRLLLVIVHTVIHYTASIFHAESSKWCLKEQVLLLPPLPLTLTLTHRLAR
jgi:hypothetical protein